MATHNAGEMTAAMKERFLQRDFYNDAGEICSDTGESCSDFCSNAGEISAVILEKSVVLEIVAVMLVAVDGKAATTAVIGADHSLQPSLVAGRAAEFLAKDFGW